MLKMKMMMMMMMKMMGLVSLTTCLNRVWSKLVRETKLVGGLLQTRFIDRRKRRVTKEESLIGNKSELGERGPENYKMARIRRVKTLDLAVK
ncbi:hypothetical protein YC2023_077393 [Brassica napus]